MRLLVQPEERGLLDDAVTDTDREPGLEASPIGRDDVVAGDLPEPRDGVADLEALTRDVLRLTFDAVDEDDPALAGREMPSEVCAELGLVDDVDVIEQAAERDLSAA